MTTILIKNGQLVSADGRTCQDILIKDGRIAAIEQELKTTAERTIDATGSYLLPGGIDVHTHLDLPMMGTRSSDDFESGTAAALAGGTTSIIDYVSPAKKQPLLDALAAWKEKAQNAVIDYGLHMSVPRFDPGVAKEMERCIRHEGIPTFKVFLAYKDRLMVSDEELLAILKWCKNLGGLLLAHCENGEIIAELQQRYFSSGKTSPPYHALSRPAYAEGESCERLAAFTRAAAGTAYFVHMSSRESTEALVKARREGVKLYGETCPQYLLLEDSVYDKPEFGGAAYVMSPPIRPEGEGHREALWKAIRNGEIEVVATDHCPFNLKGQKELGREDFRKIPNGAAGIEERLKLLYSYGVLKNRITLEQMVAVSSTNPAKIFGMYPRKGTLAVGSDADIVVWQPDGEQLISVSTHHQRVDTNIFEGFTVTGGPRLVIAGGRVQYEEGRLDVQAGAGRFIPRRL